MFLISNCAETLLNIYNSLIDQEVLEIIERKSLFTKCKSQNSVQSYLIFVKVNFNIIIPSTPASPGLYS